MSTTSVAEEIRGSCRDCFAAIVDFESYPAWQSAVREVEVRSRDPLGRGREVAFVIDLKIRRIHYALLYDYDEPSDLHWRYAGGDLRDVGGSYEFRDTATPGVVRAQYTLELDFGFSVPGPLRRRLEREVMRRSVRELKARVETRC